MSLEQLNDYYASLHDNELVDLFERKINEMLLVIEDRGILNINSVATIPLARQVVTALENGAMKIASSMVPA